jgi:tetratricopeptide (TPR) repeat protein
MRKTPVYDVADVEIHDHFIRTRPGPPSAPSVPRTQESPTGNWVRFTWPGKAPPDSVDDPGLWMMAYAHRGHVDRALAQLDVAPGPYSAQLPMYHHTRGSLLESTGRQPEAVRAYERALELEPGFAPSAINLGLQLGLTAERESGLALLDEVLARHPEAVNALRNRGGLRAEAGDLEGFVADLTRAFELHPTAELAGILADFFRDVGDVGLAGEWAGRRAALDP